MTIAELNNELIENYSYITTNTISNYVLSSSCGSSNDNVDNNLFHSAGYLETMDTTGEWWQTEYPIVFFDTITQKLFCVDKYNHQAILMDTAVDGITIDGTDYSGAKLVNLFSYEDNSTTYTASNASNT